MFLRSNQHFALLFSRFLTAGTVPAAESGTVFGSSAAESAHACAPPASPRSPFMRISAPLIKTSERLIQFYEPRIKSCERRKKFYEPRKKSCEPRIKFCGRRIKFCERRKKSCEPPARACGGFSKINKQGICVCGTRANIRLAKELKRL